MSEKFSLKWNDFHSNASKSFEVFRNEDYLHDVTLVSDDQQQVTAHKLVLSASSEYFKNIFKKNKISNPFLCLDGLSLSDLNNILDYIYNGEIQIYQEHLDRFLTIAKRFKLEGLLGGEKEEELEENNFQSYDISPPRFDKMKPVKREQTEIANEAPIQLNNQIESIDTTDTTELDEKLYENMEKTSDGTYSCKICGTMIRNKTKMKLHVETHMEGLTFPCNTCGKEFRSRNSLRNHKSVQGHK